MVYLHPMIISIQKQDPYTNNFNPTLMDFQIWRTNGGYL